MRRPLPSPEEAREILARRRTRPAPRPAPRAGAALAKFIREMDETHGRGASALEPRWREIVGEPMARVTRPQKLTRGRGGKGATLELRVAGPAALLVQHQAADILSRVNLFLGEGAVERLTISQGPVFQGPVFQGSVFQGSASPAPAGPAARRRAEPPPPAAMEAELDASLDAAPEALKAALARLGRAVLARKPSVPSGGG